MATGDELAPSSACRKSILTAVVMLESEECFMSSYPPACAPCPPSPMIPLAALSKTKTVDAGARIEDYVEKTVHHYSDLQFKSHFRMHRTSFQALLELVAPYTEARTASLENRTLACVWYLSNQETLRSISDRFGINKGSLHYYLRNFCNVLAGPMVLPKLISWPKESEYLHIANQFCEKVGFPGVIGAIDGTYVPIPGPSAFRDSYICRKGFPAFHLQAVFDSNLKFIDVFCAYPGSVHDSRVFNNSPLCKYLVENPPPSDFHLLGDSAYSLSNCLMTPYRDDGHLSAEQKTYNAKHSSTRVDIERCFGLLKGKFRKLKYLDLKTVSDIPTMIVTCCVLHNFILGHESVFSDDFVTDEMLAISEEGREDPSAGSAVLKRDAIMNIVV